MRMGQAVIVYSGHEKERFNISIYSRTWYGDHYAAWIYVWSR